MIAESHAVIHDISSQPSPAGAASSVCSAGTCVYLCKASMDWQQDGGGVCTRHLTGCIIPCNGACAGRAGGAPRQSGWPAPQQPAPAGPAHLACPRHPAVHTKVRSQSGPALETGSQLRRLRCCQQMSAQPYSARHRILACLTRLYASGGVMQTGQQVTAGHRSCQQVHCKQLCCPLAAAHEVRTGRAGIARQRQSRQRSQRLTPISMEPRCLMPATPPPPQHGWRMW